MDLLQKKQLPPLSCLRNEIRTETLHPSQFVQRETNECPNSDEVVLETQMNDLNAAVNHSGVEHALQQSTTAPSILRNPACERNPHKSINANFVFGEAKRDPPRETAATSKAPVSVGPIRADVKAGIEVPLMSKTAPWFCLYLLITCRKSYLCSSRIG
jgi:hypothetical protein